jgi:hypothetical protein
MATASLVIQGLLTLVFLLAGSMKLIQPREKVIASGGKWAADFSPAAVKIIGAGELLCALGVLIPQLLGDSGYLGLIAAAGIEIFMAGAFFTHVRRKEMMFLPLTGVIFLLGAFVCYGRLAALGLI